MSNIEEQEQLNLKNTSPPSTVEEDDVSLKEESASEVPALSEDNPELKKFNDVLIAMCEAIQFILLKCAVVTYDESKNALETSIDGGPSRITPEQKSQLQSIVDTSIRNYIVLYHLASAFEKIFRLIKRGITSNFATQVVFLTLFCSVVSGTSSACPRYTSEDISSGKVNFFSVLNNYDSCKQANTATVQEKFYIDNTEGPTKPPLTASDDTKLAYNYEKEKFDATNTYENLKNTNRLERLFQLRASEYLISSNSMFSKLSGVIWHKYNKASKIYVNKTLVDPLNPDNTETLPLQVFSGMTPTQSQIENAKNRKKQEANTQGKPYEEDDYERTNSTTTNNEFVTEKSDEDYLALKTFEELFHLDFGVSCKFVDKGPDSYSLCEYTLSGPSVDFSGPILLLETLAQQCLVGLKSLGVTGLEEQNTRGKYFLKIMSAHSQNDRIQVLGDFYTTIQRIMDIPIKLKYLVNNPTRFKNSAIPMFSGILDNEPFEQIMTDTLVPGILDEGISKEANFESLVAEIKASKKTEQDIKDVLRAPIFLKNWLREMGMIFDDIMTATPMSATMYEFLNNTFMTSFKVGNHLVLTTGNVSMTGIDKTAHFAKIGLNYLPKTAEAADKLTTTVYNSINNMAAIAAEEGIKAEKSFFKKSGELFFPTVLFFAGLMICYIGGPTVFVREVWGGINEFQEGKNKNQALRAAYNNELQEGIINRNQRFALEDAAGNQPFANPRLTSGTPQSTVPLMLTAAQQLTNEQIIAILKSTPGNSKAFKKKPDAGPKDFLTLKLVGDVILKGNNQAFTGTVYSGGTRKHKKRIGAASKHHKKRRRGTKKPSKKRRATRRKRR